MIYLGLTFLGQYAPDAVSAPEPEVVRLVAAGSIPYGTRARMRHAAHTSPVVTATARATPHRLAASRAVGSLHLTARANARHLPTGDDEALLLAAALLN